MFDRNSKIKSVSSLFNTEKLMNSILAHIIVYFMVGVAVGAGVVALCLGS